MKRILIILIIIFILVPLTSREYIIKQVLPDVGYYKIKRMIAPKVLDLGNYYPRLFIPNPVALDLYRTVVYRFTGDSFEFEINIDSLSIVGAGDFDGDGLPELLGHSVAYDKKIAVIEQQDTNQIYTIRTWESESLYNGIAHLGVTKFLKNDNTDRIYGGPPAQSDSGWYYMSCMGDNNYIFDYVLIEDREIASMDIGFIDDDSLVDVIGGTGSGQTWWEAIDSDNDSFAMIGEDFPGGVGTHYTGIMNDIDKDGKNEYIKGGLMYLMSPCMWGISIVEWDYDTVFNLILRDTISKDYGPVTNVYSGSDYDIGDVDGDGEEEIVVCAGCILRIYKVMGNDSFVKIWELDNDTFSGSHVRVHDFDEDGFAEIIWGGASDPGLPLTSFPIVSKTYIIENALLSILSYNNPSDMGNKPLSTTVQDSIYMYSTDELAVHIDSMKVTEGSYITLNTSCPCSIPSGDSIPVEFSIYSDIPGYITDTLIIYSDDWYGQVDTLELRAGTGVQIEIDSIVVNDGRNAVSGIDYDDYARIYFNYPADTFVVNSGNIDSILQLSDSHTWLDGTGNIKQTNWTDGNTVLTVFLSTNTSLPTVSVGDTVYPIMQDERQYSTTTNPIQITGSFGPAGIEQPSAVAYQPSASLSINYEQSMLNITAPTQSNLIIYDITGRQAMNKAIPQGDHTISISNIPSGIYFIKFNNINQKIFIIK